MTRHYDVGIWEINRHAVSLNHSPRHGTATARSVIELHPKPVLAPMPSDHEVAPATIPAIYHSAVGPPVHFPNRSFRQICAPFFAYRRFVISLGNHYEVVGVWFVEVGCPGYQFIEIRLDVVFVTHRVPVLPLIVL